MIDIESLTVRELQQESARAIVVLGGDNATLSQFNKQAHHNSCAWYKAVILWYIDKHGGLPSKFGPGANLTTIL